MKKPTKIKRIRINLGLTQVDLCELAEINRQTLAKIESGEIGTAKVDTLRKIANALDTNIVDLFFDKEK